MSVAIDELAIHPPSAIQSGFHQSGYDFRFMKLERRQKVSFFILKRGLNPYKCAAE